MAYSTNRPVGIPSGGTTGQVLTKASNTSFDATWQAAGGGSAITALTGDVTATGPGSVAATLASTAVTPGAYTSANITVDAKGRITAAANGSSSGDVVGPASCQDGDIAIFNGTTGKLLKAATSPAFRYSSAGVGIGSSADSRFYVAGSFAAITDFAATNVTYNATNFDVGFNATGAGRTATMAEINAGTFGYDRLYVVTKTDASNNVVTAVPSGSDVIGYAAQTSVILAAQDDAILVHGDANQSPNKWKFITDNRAPYITSVTGDTTLTPVHREMTILVDATGGAVVITGYAVAGHAGWKVTVKKIDAGVNTVTYTAAGGSGDGASVTLTLQNQSRTVQTNGTNTYTISGLL